MKTTAVCQHCGQPFEAKQYVNPTTRNLNKYCSKTCSNRANARPGKSNPNYKPQVECICKTCGKVFSVTPSRKAEGRGQFCSKKCLYEGTSKLIQGKRYNYKGGPYEMACEVCGRVVLVRHSLRNRFRACSKSCAAQLSIRVQGRGSSLETIMAGAFAAVGLSPEGQYRVSYYTVDFAFPEQRLIIECDGSYWHGRPEQKKRDSQKDVNLQRKGWRVVRLGEDEIRKDPAACVKKVRQHL